MYFVESLGFINSLISIAFEQASFVQEPIDLENAIGEIETLSSDNLL